MKYIEDEKFILICNFVKDNKIKIFILFLLLISALMNYGFIILTSTVAFFTYKILNKTWEVFNEKIDNFNCNYKQLSFL